MSVYTVWLNISIRLTETQETLSDREGEYFSNFANESCKCDSSWRTAAHARLLADQEDKEIEHLVATKKEKEKGTASGVSTSDRTAEDSAVPMSRVSAEANQASAGPNPPSAAPVHRKGFQYRRRTTFELHVYVHDGSLISEILIDHEVVQKAIGHSPKDVTAALASSDINRVRNMNETNTYHLVLFDQGTMVIQISEASRLPIAIEINQGCPLADAWLLLTRVKSYTST
ncbi:hypothetical protein RJ639_035523 [Escallonia herrerae]|uniref:RecQ-mediated genome instability protein 1 C-terminal OB-fold domain-containing protein n=1 Tax=Escallonia herrerae TaxID=1293975 RepID=A0AA88WXE1_9ASTE|nr:hypothetical protein RJ639_035523 [Escallonia herrerae]